MGPKLFKNISRGHVKIVVALMFSFSLISDTDADCEIPPKYLHAFVEEEFTSEGYSVGSSVIYTCDDGYQMSGPADHTALTCNQEEEWTGPDIDCTEKISCSLPPSPAFGSYNMTEDGLSFQSSVSFHCQAGYTLDGPVNTTCTASGEWSKSEDAEYVEPICKRRCKQENYRYQFHECYETIDDRGDWYFARTKCADRGGQLATIKDSTRQSFIANILSGDNINLYWIGGYELDRDWKYPSDEQYATYFNWAPDEPSTSNERCVYLSNVNGPQNSLKWNDEFCDKSVIDTDPNVPIYCICETDGNCSSLSTTYDTYQYKNLCLSFLDDAARDQSNSKIKCSDDLAGHLVEIKSQFMQDFIENVINANGYETANWWIGLEEGFDRTWSWVDGERIETFFWADGEPSNINENCLDILTNNEYKWNDDGCSNTDRKIICQLGEAKCGNPGIPFHGNMTTAKESYSVGDTVNYFCDKGYVISDPLKESLTCQNDSQWSGSVPYCQKISCSQTVPTIPNTVSSPVSTEYRGIAVYKCFDGNYVLNGYPVSVCQEDGTWSTPNISCTEVLTTQEYSTAPPETTYTNPAHKSTGFFSTPETTFLEHTTHTTDVEEFSLSPPNEPTEVPYQTDTIQPTTAVDGSITSPDELVTDSGTTDKTTLRSRLTSVIDETETTTLERFIQSTQENFPLSTSKGFRPTTGTTVMFSDGSVVTDVTGVQSTTTSDFPDIPKILTTPTTSSESTTTYNSFIRTTSLFNGSTDISSPVQFFTSLHQSTETLNASVRTSPSYLGGSTTKSSHTNYPQTTEKIETDSAPTNILTSSGSTMDPSQDNLPTTEFNPTGSSTLHSTKQEGSTPASASDIHKTTASTFKSTHDIFKTSHNPSKESTEETNWTSTESSANLVSISRIPSTLSTESSVNKTTDASTFINDLLSTEDVTKFTTAVSPQDQTIKTSSLETPSSTTELSFLESTTELRQTQNTNIITDISTTVPSNLSSSSPTTSRLAEVPSSSVPTSEQGRSQKPSESYSKEPELTQQPSNKGLIIGLSVTSAVLGIGICIWLMLYIVLRKQGFMWKRNRVHPSDSGSTENGPGKTEKEESPQEYTNLQMNDISNDAKPYLYNKNESIEYI